MYNFPLALVAFLTLCPVLAHAAPSPPITLTANLERPVCPEGQPAVLALTLHNEGADRLIIDGSAFEESSFQITVTDGAGGTVPRTAVGERVLTPPMGAYANSTVELNPGQTLSYRFNLARLFDLSRTGTYAVGVSRSLRPQIWTVPPVETPQQFTLTAGPLALRMTEDPTAVSGPTAYAPPPSRQPFLYVVGWYDEGISHYLVREDGYLSFSLASPPLASPGVAKGTDSLAATPDGRFLYAANDTNHRVAQFRIGEDGALFPLSPPTVPTGSIPDTLLMDPKGRFLYNLAGTAYAIGPDGRLTVTASEGQFGGKDAAVSAYHGALNPTGTALYVDGRTPFRLAPDGRVAVWPTPSSGIVGPNGGNDNAIALTPSGRFAYVGVSTTLGNAFFDKVVPMRVGADGALTPILGATLTPPAPPRPSQGPSLPDCQALSVDPTGRFLVIINPGYLDCCRIGPDGRLTFLNTTPQAGFNASPFFGPVGGLIYVPNRTVIGTDTLTAFRLDEQHGLTPSGLDVMVGMSLDAHAVLAAAPIPTRWGPVVGGLKASARLPADVLSAAAPVVLTVTLKNVTTHPISLGTAGADMASLRLTVAGPQRQSPGVLRGDGEPLAGDVPLLAAGHDLLDAPGPSTMPVVLPPGGERQYRFVLSRLADMTVAGHYTVQITRILPGGVKVASPAVPFLLDGPYNGRIWGDGRSVEVL